MIARMHRSGIVAALVIGLSPSTRAEAAEPDKVVESVAEDSTATASELPPSDWTPRPWSQRFPRADFYGWFEAEGRFFVQEPVNPQGQPLENDYWFNGSMAWQPGVLVDVTDYMNFELVLFGRVDQHDRNRTHGDIREAFFDLSFNAWTFGFGIHRERWGVVTSRDVVDIINQVDFVEDFFATDARLGQAMITTSYSHDKAGKFALYVMSWARPLIFPALQGRPAPVLPVENSIRAYESRLKQGQIDVSARWSGSQRGFDWGLSYFFGTTRQPQLIIVDATPLAETFQPFYELIHQGGLEARYVNGGWRVQAESIVRGGQGPTFAAVTGGFGYTFYETRGSIVDFGMLAEYNYDGRNNTTFIVFENDLFLGFRIDLDEPGHTKIVTGAYVDVRDGSFYIVGDASRFFGGRWEVTVGTRVYLPQRLNILEAFREDSRIHAAVKLHY